MDFQNSSQNGIFWSIPGVVDTSKIPFDWNFHEILFVAHLYFMNFEHFKLMYWQFHLGNSIAILIWHVSMLQKEQSQGDQESKDIDDNGDDDDK